MRRLEVNRKADYDPDDAVNVLLQKADFVVDVLRRPRFKHGDDVVGWGYPVGRLDAFKLPEVVTCFRSFV